LCFKENKNRIKIEKLEKREIMTPLREEIYNQLASGSTYSMSELAEQYRVSKPVMELQLQRLKEEGKQIKVSEEEVCVLLDHTHKAWPYIFWVFVGFIFILYLLGAER
jgi:hypothetical protein